MAMPKGMTSRNDTSDRRQFVRAAAGVGLAFPTFGGLVHQASAHRDGGLVQRHSQHAPAPSGKVPEGFKLYDPALPPVTAGPKDVRIVAMDATVPISSKVNFAGWTFDGTIPGRMIRVVEGDTINFTFAVDPSALIGHSLDWHSARVSPDEAYRTIGQGEELTYSFVAEYPGVYMYHCGTPPILMHIGAGMYGAMIVDPKEGWSPAQEFAFVQSDFGLVDDGTGTDTMITDYTKLLGNGSPDLTVFNGYANQYADNPIPVRVNEPVRVFVMNAGPCVWSSFHVVGTIFDRAYVNGNPKNEHVGLQSVTIGPGDGAVVEFTLTQPGHYPFVNHSFGHAAQGAVGLFLAQ
jgi:nitrite reductase (NO-forming)